ncbi:YeeE/YedE family protein [candidate division KSB1 bacterium]|nr:YeeE/YedE family protein [candidate division KSB1 bacterium]
MNLLYGLLGIFFGIVLTKSEVMSWFRIEKMFRFQEAHMYLIMGSAVLIGMVSVFLLKQFKLKSFTGKHLDFTGKTETKGFLIGGFIFGIGWAITGACPGPIFSQIGAGEWPALITLAGAILGALSYSALRDKLPH